ncbi:hypothetical protein ACFL1R_03865 [Candidatus Latescibacterota bacterium]
MGNLYKSIVIIYSIILTLLTVCEHTVQNIHSSQQAKFVRVGCRGILHKNVEQKIEQVVPCEQEFKRKEIAERMDKKDMLYTAKVAVDRDVKMLEVPENIARYVNREFTIAEIPPDIEFAIVPVEPRFLAVYNNQDESGWWGNYCQSDYYEPTGTFYSAVADHGVYDAHIYLVEYDPAMKKVLCLPEINRAIGRSKDQFQDGILHGWLDIYQSKHLSRPHLWFCTYWSRFPEPSEEDFATGYDGGHIISCDLTTGDFVDYGAPLPRTSWPYHRVDTQRGMLFAVSLFNEFLAWDINEQKTRWAGYLPKGIEWFNRSILLDSKTGMVYTSNADEYDEKHHMICYDPVKNRFSLMNSHMPPNARTGTYDQMRAQTRDRGPDGLFWGVTNSGELFTFDPDNDEIIDRGLNWPGDQRYTCTMERSPGGRYIYYQVQTYTEGAPVIQYDTKTNKKKVLAFMLPYYYEKYGYIPTGSYSLKLDDRGEKLFMLWNGAFTDYKPDLGVERFGHCAVMLMHIPENERIE